MYGQINFVGNVSLLPLLNNPPFPSLLQAKHFWKNRKNMVVIKRVLNLTVMLQKQGVHIPGDCVE